MSYATQSDITDKASTDRVRQLTDDAKTGSIDTTKVDDALEKTDAEIDSYIAQRYALPLSSPYPSVIVEIAVDLAILRLHERRAGAIPESVVKAAAYARERLGKISGGKLTLGVDEATVEDSTRAGATVTATTQARVHTRSTWSGW